MKVYELIVPGVGETELKECRALEVCLGGLTHRFIGAGKLNKKAVILQALNDRLVRTHRVDTAADNLNDALIAAFKHLFNLALYGTRSVGDCRIGGDNRLSETLGINTESEGRAAFKVKPETEFFRNRIAHIKRNCGNET